MSNIIALTIPPRRQRLTDRVGPLLACFARHRRIEEDVFWLKENAELLNILECTGQQVSQQALAPLAGFYDALPERLTFFPQYYRFLLSIGLDLEDLGAGNGQMERLCAFAAAQGLQQAELSDLQRAEARRLLARRGVSDGSDAGLDDRLHAFINRTATFALPNKKAAYELTHIVFYLSEYGRRDPMLDAAARTSLHYAGIIAYLDQDFDLLAEICVALMQAGCAVPTLWGDAVRANLNAFEVTAGADSPQGDAYHEYLVSTWAACEMGADDIGAAIPDGRCTFRRGRAASGALRAVSSALLSFEGARSGDWVSMQHILYAALDDHAAALLSDCAASAPQFPEFFETFARASAQAR